MLQPPWLSTHFVARPIFVPPSLPPKPAHSARPFGPVRPHQGIISHLRLPFTPLPLRPCHRAVRRRLPPSFVREGPNQSAIMPLSPPPLKRRHPVSSSLLTPSKPTRSKTQPPSAASPPPHHLPGPIKRTPTSTSLHRARCSPPSLFSTSPVTRHRAPLPPSPPLHHRPHPPLPRSPKPMVRTGRIPSIFFYSRGELRAFASSTSPHSDEAPVAFYPRVHCGPKCRPVYGLWT
jgi:hypothetical protein